MNRNISLYSKSVKSPEIGVRHTMNVGYFAIKGAQSLMFFTIAVS